MFRYSAFRLVIESEIELPSLPAGDGPADVVIRLGDTPVGPYKATPSEEVRRYKNLGSFYIFNGREIVISLIPGADSGMLRLALTGSGMAYLMRQRGWLPLHASGVLIDGEAALFLGESGAGKSTTAAAFHRRGHTVITDNIGAVRLEDQSFYVCPAWPWIRLLGDSRSILGDSGMTAEFGLDKHNFTLAPSLPDRSIPLRRIYVLNFGSQLRVDEIPALPAVALLSMHSFSVRRGMDPEALGIHMRDCTSIAGLTPVRRLTRPCSLGGLPSMVQTVEEDLKR